MKIWPTVLSSFAVPFEYPVVFTRDIFAPSNSILLDVIGHRAGPGLRRCMLFADENVAQRQPGWIEKVSDYFRSSRGGVELAHPPILIAGGEAAKNDWPLVERIVAALLEGKLCRHSYVLAVGGGSVLDVVGFATSLFHRGLRLIRLPTTVLAQNDAGVGVKNGVNFLGVKNLLGAFAPPFAVVNDFAFLETLPKPAWRDGIAEAFKVAMIKDGPFFDFLCEHALALARRDLPAMEETIVRCATLHLEHIQSGGDPFEFGSGRPLDFGHWSAHKLEVMSDYRITHGQAVAIGIMLDTLYAVRQGWLQAEIAERLYRGLTQSGLVLWDELLLRRAADGSLEILQGLRDFREHLGGELCVTFPNGLGRRREVNEIDPSLVEEALRRLQERYIPMSSNSLC